MVVHLYFYCFKDGARNPSKCIYNKFKDLVIGKYFDIFNPLSTEAFLTSFF